MRSLGAVTVVVIGAAVFSRGILPTCLHWPPGGGARWRRENYRGREVMLLGGAAGVFALATVLAGIAGLTAAGASRPALVTAGAVLLVGLLGLFDDAVGRGPARGLRGHFEMLRAGHVTTGAVKVVGIFAVAVGCAFALRRSTGSLSGVLVDVVLVAGCANLANLFDLRPGRALKLVGLASIGLLAAAADVTRQIGAAILGVVLGLLPDDLHERTMLGDTGANALGAATGVLATLVLGDGAAAAAAVVVIGLTIASELVSFSQVIERNRWLHWADRLGSQAPAPRR